MNKEEILAKSRSENRDQDIYEKEVLVLAGNNAAIVGCLLTLLFFVVQIFAGKGLNYGLWSIIFGIQAGVFTTKAVKLKRKHEITLAVMYIIMTVAFAAAHIYNLFA